MFTAIVLACVIGLMPAKFTDNRDHTFEKRYVGTANGRGRAYVPAMPFFFFGETETKRPHELERYQGQNQQFPPDKNKRYLICWLSLRKKPKNSPETSFCRLSTGCGRHLLVVGTSHHGRCLERVANGELKRR